MKVMRLVLILAGASCCLCRAGSANEAWTAQVVEPPVPAAKAIAWKTLEVPVRLKGDIAYPAEALLVGKFSRPEWVLAVSVEGSTEIVSRGGHFSFTAQLNRAETEVLFQMIGPGGEVVPLKLTLKVKRWKELEQRVRNFKNVASSRLVSLGYTVMSYKEGSLVDLSIQALTFKGSCFWLLSNRWDAAISGFINVLPTSTSGADESIRFFGMSLRVGYVVPVVRNPWRLSLMTGLSYSSSVATNSD